MKKVLFICSLLILTSSFAQQYTLPVDLVKTFMKDKNTSLDMVIKTKLGDDNFYETIVESKDNTKSFKLRPLTYPNFEIKLKQAIKDVITTTEIDGEPLETEEPNPETISKNIRYVFAEIITYHNTEEAKPVVAKIYLKSSEIPIYYRKQKKLFEKAKDTFLNTIKKVSVEISFYGGFIEKIQLQGTINEVPLTFNNKYSIGISSTKNIQELDTYRLFSDNTFSDTEINNMSKKDSVNITKETQEYSNEDNRLRVNVSDIIRYVKKVDVNANDVSPVPQLLILDKNQTESELHKEETSKLFEAVVYTDFLGLFDEDNPNGIVQTEVNKRFNINTKRTDTKWYHKLLFLPLISEGIGTFQYLDASFQFSKIESDSKFVTPDTFTFLKDDGTIDKTEDFYSPISLMRRRNFAIGGILNLVTMENQNAKLNMYINAGFLFGRTSLKNSIDDLEGFHTNNLEIPFEYQFHILPEKRVSFSISDRLSWFETFDSNINLKSIEDNLLTSKNRWLNSFNIDFNVDVSGTGRLFLRYKLTHELDNINNNFSRLQFGYSFYLLKNNGVKKKLN
ncbi:hypothetical protein [Algibacter pacificus]|uniref:hypothetical protein n=1 Tax=Algibacter pacificus TaxID=2599389 RepID=UPI0011C79FFD|nr:hypothetical protein [Algibacter pacificus]